MGRRWRHILISTAIALGSMAAARLLSGIRFFEILNLKALDAHFVLRGARPTSNIVLIFTDQKALDNFQELQVLWHPYYAQAIRAAGLGGAKVIGLDLAFGIKVEDLRPGYDGMLVEAVTSSPIPVIVGYVPEFNTNQASDPVPVNMVSAALGQSGFANLTADADDFVRRQELLEAPGPDGAPQARSLALRVAEKYLGQDAVYAGGRLTLAGAEVPIDAERSIYINYAGPPKTFPHVSLFDVVQALNAGRTDQLREWFADKIVLLGTDQKNDRFGTSFFTLFSGTEWLTPGVEIHANTVQTILDRSYLTPVPDWVRLAAMLAVCAVTVGLAAYFSAGPAVAGVLAVGLVVALATHLLFRANIILSTSEVMVAATFALVAGVIYRFSHEQRRGALYQQAVSLFVSKKVAQSLEAAGGVKLQGKRAVVTILFTDIRGFTAFSEKLCDEQGPEVLVELLNNYMKTMAGIIVAYGGHVNKYIGDGILAVFSDEDEGAQPGDHPLRAVRCATRMVTTPMGDLKTGAGLHTGLVIVGNVGSADKMEYTVLGDTVNLASRLESLNKEHHTRLLMSETTQQALNGAVKTTHLGSVPVRGKAAPIHLYTVTSLMEEVVHA
jgi:adenylate cyclase